MALLLWLRRKDYDGIPRIFVTPEPPPYWIFRVFAKMNGKDDGSAQPSGGKAKGGGLMGSKSRRDLGGADGESKAVEVLTLQA